MASLKGPAQGATLSQNGVDFHKIPWCNALLTAPNTTVYVPPSRDPLEEGKPNRHDRFFGKTLDHAECIPACLAFYATPAKAAPAPAATAADDSARGPAIPQVSVLFALGPGMAGYPAVLHGGVTALLFDELLGMLGERNRDLGRGDAIFTMKPATATMDVRYLRPIATPSVVLGVGTIASITGRKMLLRGEIRDAEGNVVATCESLWVAMAGREKEKL
ncbi:Verlamelin biosynthesis protein B like [Verticillium longisporum]|nr:Verlamelin biosynthesis protein B like [Verticillium longisporum]